MPPLCPLQRRDISPLVKPVEGEDEASPKLLCSSPPLILDAERGFPNFLSSKEDKIVQGDRQASFSISYLTSPCLQEMNSPLSSSVPTASTHAEDSSLFHAHSPPNPSFLYITDEKRSSQAFTLESSSLSPSSLFPSDSSPVSSPSSSPRSRHVTSSSSLRRLSFESSSPPYVIPSQERRPIHKCRPVEGRNEEEEGRSRMMLRNAQSKETVLSSLQPQAVTTPETVPPFSSSSSSSVSSSSPSDKDVSVKSIRDAEKALSILRQLLPPPPSTAISLSVSSSSPFSLHSRPPLLSSSSSSSVSGDVCSSAPPPQVSACLEEGVKQEVHDSLDPATSSSSPSSSSSTHADVSLSLSSSSPSSSSSCAPQTREEEDDGQIEDEAQQHVSSCSSSSVCFLSSSSSSSSLGSSSSPLLKGSKVSSGEEEKKEEENAKSSRSPAGLFVGHHIDIEHLSPHGDVKERKKFRFSHKGGEGEEEEWRERTRNLPHLHVVEKYLLSLVCNPSPSASSYPDLSKRAARSILEILRVYVHLEEDRQKQKENIEREERTNEAPSSETQAESYITPCPCSNTCISSSLYSPSEALLQKREEIVASRGDREGDRKYEANLYQENVAFLSAEEKSERNLGLSMDERQEEKDEGSEEDEKTKRVYFRCQSDKKRKEVTQGKEEVEIQEESFVETEDCTSSRYVDLSRFLSSLLFIHERTLFKRVSLLDLPSSSSSRYFTDHVTLSCSSFSSLVLVQPVLYELLLDALNLLSFLPRWKDAVSRIASSSMYLYLSCFPSWRKMSHQETSSSSSASSFPPFYSSLKETILSGEISEERTQIGDVSSSLSPRSKRSIDTLFPLQSLLLSCRARHPTGSPQIEEKRACLLRRLLCEESEGIHLLVDRLHELLLPPMKRMVDSGDKRRNLVTHVSHNEVFSLSSYLHSSEIKRRKGENGERKDPCSCPTGLDWNGEISLHSKKEREEERAKGGKNFVLLSVYLYFLSLLCSPDQTYIAKQATSLSLAWFLILFQPSSSSFLSSSREQRSSDFLLYPPSLFLRLLFQQIVSVLRPFLLTGEREEERDDRADSRGRGREDEERVKEEKEEEVQGEASHAVVLGFLYLLESLSHLLCEFLLVSSSTASSSSFLQHERTHPIEEEEKKKKDSTDREIPGSNFVHERTLEQEKEEDQESHLSSATEPVDGKKNERSKEFSSACRDGLQERICSTLLSLQAPAVLTAFSLCDSSFLSFSSSSSSVSLCPSLSSLSSPSFSSSLTSSFSSSFSSFCDSLPSPLPVHCIAAAAYGKLVKAVSSLYDQMGEANDGEMHKTSLRLLYNEVKRITCTAFEQKITSSSSSSLSSPLDAGEKMKEVLSVGNARERRRRESLDEEADKIHRQVSADCVGTMTESSEKLSGQVKEKKNEEEEEKDVRERRRKEEKSLEEELRVLRHEEEERRKKEREDEGEEEREEEETDDRRVLLKDREEEMPKKKERCHRNTQQVFSFNPIDGRRTVEKFENLSFFFSLLSSSLLRWNPSVYSSFIHFILGLFLTFSSADDFPHPHSSLCSFSSSSSSSPFSSSRRKSRRRCHRLLTKKGLDALRGAVSPHDSSVDSRDFWRRLFLDLYTPSSSSSSREKKNTSPHEKEEEKNKKRREDEGCRELEKEWSHTREVRRVKRNSKEKRQESCHEISDVLPADGVKVWSSVFLWMSHVVREVSGEEDIGVSGVCTPPPQGMKKEKSRDILRRKKKLDEDEKHISKNVGRKKNRENFCRRRPSFVDSFVIEGGEGSLLEDLAEGILLAWWGGLVHALMEVQLKAKQEEIKENSEEEEEEKKGFSLSKRKKKKERETKEEEEEEERERRNGKREEEERKKTRGEQVEGDEKKERGKKTRTSITVEEENEREHEKESECVSSSSSPSRLTSHCGLGLDNLKGDDRSVWVLFAFLPFQFVENLLSSTEILSQRFVLDQIGSREEERGRDEEEEKRRRSFLLLDFLWSLLSTCIRCISHILFSSLPELFGSSCLPSSFSLGRKGGSFSFSPPHLYSSLLRSFATLVHTRVLPLLHFSASHLSLSAPISTTSPFLSMLRLFSLSPSLSPSPFSSCSSSLSFLLRLPSSFSETFSSQTPPSLLLQTFPFISGETPDHTSMKEHRHSLQHHCRHKDDLLLLDGISKSSFTSSSSLSHTFSPLSSSSSLFSFLQILIFRCCDALIHLDVPPERRKCTAFSPHLFSSLQQGRSIQPSTHEKEEEEADSNIPNTSTPSSSFSSSLLPPLSSAPHPFRLSAIPSMKTPCPSQDISCAYEVLRDSLRVFKSLLLLPSLLSSSSSSPFFSSSALHRHSRVAMLLKLLSKREGLFLGEVTREKNRIEREEERERIRWLWTSLLHVGTYYTDLRSDILQLAYEILEISRGREGSVDVEKDLVQEEEQEIQEEEERDGGTKKTEEDSDIAVVEEMKKKKREEEDEEEERRRELRRGSVLWKTIVIEAGGLRSEYKAIVEDVLLHFFHIRDIAQEKEKEVKWRSKEEEESEEKRKKDDTMKGKAEKEEKKKNRLFDAAIQLLTLRSLGGEGRRKEEKIQLKREEDEIDRQEDMSDDPGEDQIDVKEEKDEVEREEEKEEARRKGSDRFEKQEEEEESEGSNLIAWLYREGEEREEEVLYLLSLLIRQLLKKRKDEGQGEEGEEKLRWIERREKEDMILLHGKLRQAYQVEAHERKTPQPIQETFVDWPVDCACDRCREADHVDCLDE